MVKIIDGWADYVPDMGYQYKEDIMKGTLEMKVKFGNGELFLHKNDSNIITLCIENCDGDRLVEYISQNTDGTTKQLKKLKKAIEMALLVAAELELENEEESKKVL